MHTDNYWYHWPGFQEKMNKKNTEKGTFSMENFTRRWEHC